MSQRSVRILHVDDDPEFADLTATFLEREERFSVATATSAAEALDVMGDRPPDCVVSDYNMADRDGIAFLRSVRDDWPHLPFILFTGKGGETVASEAISAGVTDYLQKQSGVEQYELLANRIANAVSRYRARTNYRELFDKTDVGLVICDPETGTILDANRAYTDIAGYDREQIVGKNPAALSPEESLYSETDAAQHMNDAVEGGPETFEWLHETEDGDEQWVEVTLRSAVLDGQQRVLASVVDITDRRAHEQQLERQNDLFRKAQEIADVGTWEYDVRADTAVWTDQTYEIHGLPRETEPTPERALECYHPDDRETIRDKFEAAVERGEPYEAEARLLTPDGDKRWVRTRGDPQRGDGEVVRVRGTIRDITDQKEHERELREERTFIDQGLDTINEVFYAIEPDGSLRRWNDRLVEVTGRTDEAVAGMSVVEFFPADERERIAEAVDETLSTGEATVEADLLTADGDRIPYEFTGARLTDPDGELAGLVGFGRDLTDLRERERRLKQTQRRMELALEATGATVWEWHPETDRVENYPSPNPILGADVETSAEFRSYAHPEDRPAFEEALNTTLETGEPYDIELRMLSDGEVHWVRDHGRIFATGEEAERLVVGVLTDITDHKERETALRRERDRHEEFANVLSHDLRNPLNVAEGRLKLARKEHESLHLDAVARAHERMETLIEDLLELSSQVEAIGETESIDLAGLVETCWRNVQTGDAVVDTSVDRTIEADRSRLAQLLENLIRNAVEHGGDDVTVTVGELDRGFYVEDDGPGIPEDERNDVLDAGYSTTEGGTGFGLSIVKQISEAHGWDVDVTEGLAGGARFEITGVTGST